MNDALPDGFPKDLCTLDTEGAAVTMRIDAALYPLSALYGASYIFIDRCFVLLGRPDPSTFSVTLSWRKGEPPAGALRDLAGEFVNELLSCAWRAKINEESRSIIESVTAQAFAGAMGPPSLDDLEKFDFTEEAFEDPLGIAMSWEDKYGKKKDKAKDVGAEPVAMKAEGGAEPPAAKAEGGPAAPPTPPEAL